MILFSLEFTIFDNKLVPMICVNHFLSFYMLICWYHLNVTKNPLILGNVVIPGKIKKKKKGNVVLRGKVKKIIINK